MRVGHRWLIGALMAVVAAPVLIALGGAGSLAAGATIYVDADAMGLGDGSSWPNAFTGLQAALDAASSGDQIWVAEGTYTPTVAHGGIGERYRSFQLESGVALYGGFDPSLGAIWWEHRNWTSHLAVLSGDLNGDDGPEFANNGENSYHVFYHQGTSPDSTAILDGFTITGGNADDAVTHYRGGGMYNYRASPSLSNVTFAGNSASEGGGMYNDDCSPVLTGVTFAGNSAGDGGGMHNHEAAPSLIGCAFAGNSAGDEGGGMYNDGSSPGLAGCTFAGNSAGYGGGMYNYNASSPTLATCAFDGNAAQYGGGGIYNYASSSPTLTNCTLTGNSSPGAGGGMRNYSSSPALINCTFTGNSAGSGGGIYNRSSSPSLTNCILWGDGPQEIWNYPDASAPVVTYSDVQGGHEGDGNIDANPFFVDLGDGEPRLGACSPCIDAGHNDAPNLPLHDFEGDDRVLDGDDDGTATVDMGADEVTVAATCSRSYLPLVFRGY